MLLRRALANVDGPVILDVPKDNLAWLRVLRSLGFVEQREFLRMTRGAHALRTDWSRCYAISGPDFG